MTKSADATPVLQAISFAGRSVSAVKTLRSFKKSFHSVPDAITPTTTAFVQRLAETEMAEEGERFFQQAKACFGYKRKELNLDLAAGQLVLSAKDFVFEIGCALSDAQPSDYVLRRALHSIRRVDFLHLEETQTLFANVFSEVIFTLNKGAPVEQVIDAIENLDTDQTGLKVTYPSDCRECTIAVEGVGADVRFIGHELAVVFPRKASPLALWEGFLAVRRAFALSKNTALAGLLGDV